MTPNEEKPQLGTAEAEITSPESSLIQRGFSPRRLFHSFTYRDYRYFWTGALLSNIGTWMQMIALGWIVLEMTNSAFYVGLVNFTSQIPVFFLVFLAGVAADRFNRKNLVILTQTVAMVLAFLLGFLIQTHQASISLIMIISIGTGISTAVAFPAWQALISDIVPKKNLMNAIALNSAQFQSSRMVGPAIAGLVLATWGASSNFYINGVSFIAVIIALFLMRPSIPDHGDAGDSLFKQLKTGFTFAWERPAIRVLLSTTALVTFFGLSYIALMPVFARDILKGGATGFGFLMAANGGGAVVGALAVAYLANVVRRDLLIKSGAIVCGASLMLFSLSRSFLLSMCILVVTGAGFLVTTSSLNTSLQHLTPGAIRGRIMSMFVWCFMGMMPFGSLIAGAIAEKIGAPIAVFAGGSLTLLTGLSLLFMRSLDLVDKP